MIFVIASFCIALILLFSLIGGMCLVTKWAWVQLVDLLQTIFRKR